MSKRVLAQLFSLVVALSSGVAAERVAAAGTSPDANGFLGSLRGQGSPGTTAPQDAAPGRHACFELNNTSEVLWYIDVTFDPNVYPYSVTGGTISGTICGAGEVAVVSGSIGSTVRLRASDFAPACGPTVRIVGTATVPDGYQGTYILAGGTTYSQHLLFLGYDRASCP
jgi:hypothetical protein